MSHQSPVQCVCVSGGEGGGVLAVVVTLLVAVDLVDAVAAVVVVVALLNVTGHIYLWSINVNLRLLKATVEFLLWGGVWFAQSFLCPTQLYTVFRLCCVVVVGIVTKFFSKVKQMII